MKTGVLKRMSCLAGSPPEVLAEKLGLSLNSRESPSIHGKRGEMDRPQMWPSLFCSPFSRFRFTKVADEPIGTKTRHRPVHGRNGQNDSINSAFTNFGTKPSNSLCYCCANKKMSIVIWLASVLRSQSGSKSTVFLKVASVCPRWRTKL